MRPNRTRTSLLTAVFAALPASLAARADLPAALDRVPPEAVAVIATPSVERMDKSMAEFMAAAEFAELPTFAELLAVSGLGAGLDRSGSMAVVVMPGDLDAPAPPAVALVPTTDYNALLANLAPQKEGGLDTFVFNGDTVYAKPLAGGYAAVGPIRELVEAFEGAGGNLAAHAAVLGAHTREIAETSDLFVYVNMPALRPLVEEDLRETVEGIEQSQEEMAQMMPDMGFMLESQAELFDAFLEAFDESRAVVLGADADAVGVSVRFAADFTPGSEMADLFRGGAASGELLDRLPDRPFLFAGACAMDDPLSERFTGWSLDFIRSAQGMMNQMNAAMGMGEVDMGAYEAILEMTDGFAGALYQNPAGPMAGFMSYTAYYTETEQPAELLAHTRTMLENMLGAPPAAPDMPKLFDFSFVENDGEIAGVEVDSWSMTMNQDAMGGAMGPFGGMMAMIYGQNPGGHMAAMDGGVLVTYTKDRAFNEEAIAAAKGGGGALHNATLKAVRGMLPGEPAAEFYVGFKAIYDSVAPMMMMMMGQALPPLEQDVPPVGFAVANGNGGTTMALYLPADVVSAGKAVVEKLEQMQQRQMQPGGQNQPPF